MRRGYHTLATLALSAAIVLLAGSDASAQFKFFQVAAAGQAAPSDVGGIYTAFFRPSLDNTGRITFKAMVSGATNGLCPTGVDCQVLLQTRKPGFDAFNVATEGHTTLIGQLQIIDDKPVNVEGKVYHNSCYGPGSPTAEGILRQTTTLDQVFLGGADCQTKFGQVSVNRSGTAYWRALFEAVVFLSDDPGAIPVPLVNAGDATGTRLLGTFVNLAKARSVGWETTRRQVRMNSLNSLVFLSEVTGTDVDAGCLGTEGFCDGVFIVDTTTGAIILAVAKGDSLTTGDTIARFCGPPSVNDGGDVLFRALVDPNGDCDSLTGSGQGIYRIEPPFLPGTAHVIVDSTTFLPDETTGTSFTTGIFSDPEGDSTGNIYFRAGDPQPGGTTGAIIQASPPFPGTAYSVVAVKGGVADPDNHRFTSFDPESPAVNDRGQLAILTGEGIFFGSAVSVLVSDCMEAIFSVSLSLSRREMRVLRSCASKILRGKLPLINCRTESADVARKLQAARDQATGKLARFCPDQVMPFIDPCDPSAPNSQGQIDCIIGVHEAVIDDLFAAWLPEVFP